MTAGTKLHRNVLALGLVSLLTDLSSEMIYPLLRCSSPPRWRPGRSPWG